MKPKETMAAAIEVPGRSSKPAEENLKNTTLASVVMTLFSGIAARTAWDIFCLNNLTGLCLLQYKVTYSTSSPPVILDWDEVIEVMLFID